MSTVMFPIVKRVSGHDYHNVLESTMPIETSNLLSQFRMHIARAQHMYTWTRGSAMHCTSNLTSDGYYSLLR